MNRDLSITAIFIDEIQCYQKEWIREYLDVDFIQSKVLIKVFIQV